MLWLDYVKGRTSVHAVGETTRLRAIELAISDAVQARLVRFGEHDCLPERWVGETL